MTWVKVVEIDRTKVLPGSLDSPLAHINATFHISICGQSRYRYVHTRGSPISHTPPPFFPTPVIKQWLRGKRSPWTQPKWSLFYPLLQWSATKGDGVCHSPTSPTTRFANSNNLPSKIGIQWMVDFTQRQEDYQHKHAKRILNPNIKHPITH